jgi:uncharacterized SAM-binding protein YcdF (DUF218 family)
MNAYELILVLGAGGERGRKRLEGALKLYNKFKIEGKNPLIIFSGYDVEKDKSLENEIKNIEEKGYEFFVERFSKTTNQNKQYSEIIVRKFLENGYKINNIAIVTDNPHIIRSRAIFGNKMYNIPIEYYSVGDFEKKKNLLYEALAFILRALRFDDIIARKRR